MHGNGSTPRRLTKTQERILAYVQACVRDDGIPPTHDEIRRRFDLRSTYGVRQHLRLIKNKGYIELLSGKSRGIRLLTPPVQTGLTADAVAECPRISRKDAKRVGLRVFSRRFVGSNATFAGSAGIAEIPIVGRIAAGQPILAEEHLEGRIAVSAELFPPGVLFALRVKGESMVNVGIRTGDLAVIRRQARVENGQIGAVLRDDEATLKRVYVFGDHVCLKAENDTEPDMRIDKGTGVRVDVLGLYVGLIRQAR